MIIGEDSLEKVLQAQGVLFFHPQRDHGIYEQIRVLCRHKTIIGFAGSALHTLMLSGGNKKVIAYSARKIPSIFPLLDKALANKGVYVKSGRMSLNGLAELSVGFKPQLIDPRIVLHQLKRQNVISDDTVLGYGTAESDAQEVRRYNTALLLRWVLKASQTQTEGDCHAFIQKFVNDYALDIGMLEQARQGSELMRRFF